MSSGFQTTEELLSDAIDLMDDHEYGAALPLLTRVVSFEPKNEVAYELWVNCHFHLERFERVLELADAGLANGLAPVGLHIAKANVFRVQQREDEAFLAARAALDADPSSPSAILAMIEIASGSGRTPLVIEHARNYLRLFDKDGEVLYLLAKAYLEQGDHKRADRAFRDAAEIDPESIDNHVGVLVVANLTGNHEAAVRYLERLDPELGHEVQDEFERVMGLGPEEDAP